MTGHISRLAGAFLLFVAGAAMAATPLLLPAASSGAKAKSARHMAVQFNAAGIARLEAGDEVELTLPDGSRHTYLHESSVDHGGGLASWIARSPVTGNEERAVITYGPNGAWGWMATGNGQFRIYPSGEGYDLLAPRADRDDPAPKLAGGDAVLAGDDPPEIAHLKGIPTFAAAAMKSGSAAKAAPTPTMQADLMFIYTKDLADKLGVGMMPMLYNLVATLNTAFFDSEVALVVRLVRAHKMDYPNANSSAETLDGMRNIGPFAPLFDGITFGAANIRDQVGADFVALLRDGPVDTAGISSLLINQSQYPSIVTTQTAAMSVNNGCARGCQATLAHELGHNMGNVHDRATVARDANGTMPLPQGVFPYSYGHYSCSGGLTCNPFVPDGCSAGYADCAAKNANDFGTIMSYFAPRVMKYSNPNILCTPAGGAAPGRACGGPTSLPAPAGASDEAASMNHVRGNVAAYRTQTYANAPASIQFTNTAFTATETGGVLTFTLSRIGGTAGAVAVNYTLASSTATAGADFGAGGGTVQWADGDGTNKTFNVTIVNDGTTEGNETFTALLSNPTGAPGAYLGHPSIATGIIVEPWPPNATAPSGFTNPSGPPWTVALAPADSTFDGTGSSWKSGTISFPCPPACGPPEPAAPQASTTEFTGNFVAGTLAFAYRVNSYPGEGMFEFLIDGTVIHSDSGDSGWRFFSILMTAGNHTLQWRYRPTRFYACSIATPPPPQGNSCADRAWIDSVALPLAPASSSASVNSSLNPSQVGQSVTFTATLSGSFGVPTGTVTFNNGPSPLPGCTAVLLVNGTAACTTSTLSSGTHNISVQYSGSPTYAASFSTPIVQIVSSGALLLSASPGSLPFGGQSMNTTSPALVSTITNTSGSPVTVTAVTGTSVFGATHNCSTLAPGATCQVSVTFKPPVLAETGPASGAVAIEYAGGGPTSIVADGTAERSLVTHYYRSILRRAPDGPGKTFWNNEATRVATLGANLNEVWYAMAQAFYFSPEYAGFNRSNTAFVTDMFNTFFNRAPDSGGLAFWVDQLNAGLPREVALAAFMFSTEFSDFTLQIFANQQTRAEVDTLTDFYRGLLARLPDNAGFNYWIGRFRAAQCQGSAQVTGEVEAISSAYATSPEYANRSRTDAQYVGDLYNSFLRRGGDLPGVAYWIGQIANGTQTREQVRVQFKNSAEFAARVSAIVNQGCLP